MWSFSLSWLIARFPTVRVVGAAAAQRLGNHQQRCNGRLVMKFIPFILLILVFNTSNAQPRTLCNIIDTILSYKQSIKDYYFDKTKDVPIIIVDTSNYFKDCSFNTYYGRSVTITHDHSHLKEIVPGTYVIQLLNKKGKNLKLRLIYRNNGAQCRFVLKRRNGNYSIVKYYGSFL